MLYEIIFCFFTVFGIMQILGMIKDFCISRIPKDMTMVVGVDENTNLDFPDKELKQKGVKLVFVYSGINAKQLEILKRRFEYASFVKRETLSEDVLEII